MHKAFLAAHVLSKLESGLATSIFWYGRFWQRLPWPLLVASGRRFRSEEPTAASVAQPGGFRRHHALGSAPADRGICELPARATVRGPRERGSRYVSGFPKVSKLL